MTFRLTTLGDLRLSRAGRELASFPARPLRAAVVVYLACERVTTRDRLLNVFWPDRPPAKGRRALTQTLYELRQELSADWVTGRGDQFEVTDGFAVDKDAFEEAAGEGQHEAALEIYSGHFLDGFYLADTNEFENWVFTLRDRLRGKHYELFRHLVEARGADEDLDGVLAAARAWAEWYPHSDEAQYCLVAGLARAGRRSDALRQFAAFERRLKEELEAVPSPDVWDELLSSIRSGDVSAEFATREHADRRGSGTRQWGSSPSSGPRLVRIAEGGRQAESYPLRMGDTTVGRERADLRFSDDRLMSGRHARFRLDREGPYAADVRCILEDEDSRNGVYLRIRDDWPLRDGDMFAVGQQVFRFEGPAATAPYPDTPRTDATR